MSSEDLFEEDFSEEIITELEQEYVNENFNNVEQDEVLEEEGEHNKPEQEATNAVEETPTNNTENDKANKSNTTAANRETKLFQLPLTRIRNIMKLDPDLHISSNEAVFLVTRATELFIESLAQESYTFTIEAKKKTVQKRDVDLAIEAVDSLMFLDGAMTF